MAVTTVEHATVRTTFFPAGERVRRLDEACQIIKRMWTEPVVTFEGRYYQLQETYCEPKPVQKPTPPFVIGGMGEELTPSVVARHADTWNYAGLPFIGGAATGETGARSTARHLLRRNRRDPATLARSVQLIIDPHGDVVETRQQVHEYITAGRHISS